ncbi:unnamed protein product [Cuscuta campestris]|uniref:DM2 domain-containing protein n=1 Tax=Cuscuta campestris TaxID=132261 RepID=A0A484MZ41_9ASTE|nr:unnamed protein product [Cuscuta campestris]
MQTPQSVPVSHSQQAAQPNLLRGPPHFPGHFQVPNSQTVASAQGGPSQSHLPPHPQPQSTRAANTNVGVSSPAAKRVPPRPHSRPAGQGQVSGPMLKTMELAPAARKRKRKLPDKHLPEKVASLLPESALYTQLLKFESRLDASLVRMKTNIMESVKNPQRVQKTLRVYVFNTYSNQTWSLRIFGRILDNQTPSDPKFSSFFKKITVYLDQTLYSDNHVILWESSRSPKLRDGFEVRRKGDKEFTALIRLEMNHLPEKYKLSPALQDVLGIEVETRARILNALWQYVKAKNLQIPDETSSFMCDPPLRKIFGEEKMKFCALSQKIDQHLTIPQPIHLEHKVRLSGDSPSGNACYDILVDVPFMPQKEMLSYLESVRKNKEIDACDEAISSAIKKIHEHYQRRSFFLGFSQSPAEFINALIASQARDLKIVSGDSVRDEEHERRSGFYHQAWVEDAVIRYLNRKAPAGQ